MFYVGETHALRFYLDSVPYRRLEQTELCLKIIDVLELFSLQILITLYELN